MRNAGNSDFSDRLAAAAKTQVRSSAFRSPAKVCVACSVVARKDQLVDVQNADGVDHMQKQTVTEGDIRVLEFVVIARVDIGDTGAARRDRCRLPSG